MSGSKVFLLTRLLHYAMKKGGYILQYIGFLKLKELWVFFGILPKPMRASGIVVLHFIVDANLWNSWACLACKVDNKKKALAKFLDNYI